MRILPLRWQKAVTALFLTRGNQSEALRLAGYNSQGRSQKGLHVTATRIFADARVRAAVREVAAQQIDIAEPEMLAITLGIIRDQNEPARDRLRAVSMIWDRSNPVVNKLKLDIEHHLSTDELDITHYRALQRLGAPQEAFIARFGQSGLARVQAMVAAESVKTKQIEGPGAVVDATYEEVKDE
jgi:hypothetical protein